MNIRYPIYEGVYRILTGHYGYRHVCRLCTADSHSPFSAYTVPPTLPIAHQSAGLPVPEKGRYAGRASPYCGLPAGSSQKRAMPDVCPHWAIPICRKSCGCPKESRGTCRYLVVVIGKCSVKACSVTYFCNHFRSYSWVSTMTFLHTSISSMLSFSNL